LLAIRGLRHAYGGQPVLSIPDWSVAQGEASLVVGPSGSGKSTLLAILSGLLTPSEGEVTVAGTRVNALDARGRDRFRAQAVGIVLQKLHLIGVIDVRENLRLARRLAGQPEDAARVDETLAALGIERLAHRKAASLSVGEQQRVAIARAVVNRPRVILADEPTAALDDANAAKAVALLADQAAACGATLIVATHDRRIVDRFTNRLEL
jgi:putative ABC transport system ATP-binding protein